MSVIGRFLDFFSRMTNVAEVTEEAARLKQSSMGKMTARQRILTILDSGSFHEYDLFVEHKAQDFGMAQKVLPGDGVITGTGTILNHPVCIYAQDFTVAGGVPRFGSRKKNYENNGPFDETRNSDYWN